nr:hypothetical protein GCM10017745_47050 [Saccharothrix mutabilis subsp. capreolus]
MPGSVAKVAWPARTTASASEPGCGRLFSASVPSVIPDVWLSSCRTVIFSPRGSSTRKSGRYLRTGASNSTRPASTSRITASAVNDLLTDATGIGVAAVTGAPDESLPYPATCST